MSGVVISNGNKVEVATGYYTYCGDDVGCISPLGDLTKAEVFEMARLYPQIDTSLLPDENYDFKIPPSAELKDKQVDPFLWGCDDAIIDRLITYKKASREDLITDFNNGTLLPSNLKTRYFGDDVHEFVLHLEWLLGLIDRSVWKRVQAPPIVVTSKQAFGYDLRETLHGT